MRSTSTATIFATLLLLAGCATSPDPAQGGFISGVNGLLSGGYKQRVAEQSTDLEQMRVQQAAAEAQSSQATAALSARERQVAALRSDVARLDRSLRDAQAKAARQQMHNATLSDRDRQLISDLASAKARLAVLQSQLSSNQAADDYDASRQDYLKLEAAIEALTEQLKGDRR